MPDVQVKWVDASQFIGIDSSKHSVVMSDQDEANGVGVSPSDLLAIGLGGCSAIDVVAIMLKKRQKLTGLTINVHSEKDADPPWTYRKIHIEYVLRGHDLSPEAIERSIELAEDKYCAVKSTIAATVEVTHSYRIEEEE